MHLYSGLILYLFYFDINEKENLESTAHSRIDHNIVDVDKCIFGNTNYNINPRTNHVTIRTLLYARTGHLNNRITSLLELQESSDK